MSARLRSAAQNGPALACRGLRVSIAGRLLVDRLDLILDEGSMLGVLGQNGSGKTTTLHTLAGLHAPSAGRVELYGESVPDLTRRRVARRLGLMLQHQEDPFPSTVLETAMAGRHPHIDMWRWESQSDLETAIQALAEVGLDGLEDRVVDTLSGGERRRLSLATLLAQTPDIYLLDEPTNHLDPAYERKVMTRLRDLADAGRSVAASLHDVNLASRFCDRCLLLFGDGSWREGETQEVLTEETLSRLYGINMHRIEWKGESLFFAA
jgi:iron complex transport system ATP-binding protein